MPDSSPTPGAHEELREQNLAARRGSPEALVGLLEERRPYLLLANEDLDADLLAWLRRILRHNLLLLPARRFPMRGKKPPGCAYRLRTVPRNPAREVQKKPRSLPCKAVAALMRDRHAFGG